MEESMIGKKVRYSDEAWEVVHVTEDRRAVIARIGVDVKMGAIRVDPFAVMVDLDEIEEIPHEMTAKEYAEKLREYFGKPDIGKLDITEAFCSKRGCEGCAFDAEPDKCAAAVCMFDPERALQMIQEQENKEKPKGKTYLEDFREKMPNAFAHKNGRPGFCRRRLYNADGVHGCEYGIGCDECWNEEMPEVSDNAEG